MFLYSLELEYTENGTAIYFIILFLFVQSRAELLTPQRAPPQVADWRMLIGLPKGTGEIKYPEWTKTNNKPDNG